MDADNNWKIHILCLQMSAAIPGVLLLICANLLPYR